MPWNYAATEKALPHRSICVAGAIRLNPSHGAARGIRHKSESEDSFVNECRAELRQTELPGKRLKHRHRHQAGKNGWNFRFSRQSVGRSASFPKKLLSLPTAKGSTDLLLQQCRQDQHRADGRPGQRCRSLAIDGEAIARALIGKQGNHFGP
jgi:hypothetical protein